MTKKEKKRKRKKNPSLELRRRVRRRVRCELDEVGAWSAWLGKGDEVWYACIWEQRRVSMCWVFCVKEKLLVGCNRGVELDKALTVGPNVCV